MSDLYLVYFDETGTERESVPFQGRWSSLAEGARARAARPDYARGARGLGVRGTRRAGMG
jgi:hypothetical protein